MSRRKRKSRRKKRPARGSSSLLQNGMYAFRRADYGNAIKAWEQASEQTPERPPTAALAEAYFRRGIRRAYGRPANLQGGMADLQRATSLMPDDPCYVYHLGLAAHHQGDMDLAIQCYARVRQGDTPLAQRAAYPLALILLQRGDDLSASPVWADLTDEERVMLTQARAFDRRPYALAPDAPVLWRGMAAVARGEFKEARSLLTQALDTAHDGIEQGMAHYYLGVAAARKEDWQEAGRQWSTAYRKGLRTPELSANLGEAYHRLAEERLQSQDVDGALEAAQEARRHKPQDRRLGDLLSHICQQKADAAVSTGDWARALEWWEQARTAGGDSFRLSYNRALAYEHAEDYDAAAQTWRKTLRRRPRKADHPDAIDDAQVARLWRHTAEAYAKAGDYAEAIVVCRQALKWDPDDLETRMALAEGLLNDGRLEAARNELDRVLERDPDHIPALLRMGEVLSESEWWWGQSGATRYWQRVLELDSDNASARELLVDYYVEQAERAMDWDYYDAAITQLKEALSYCPGDVRVLATLGHCYLGKGKEQTALDLFEQALAPNPQDLDVHQHIIHAWIDMRDADRAWEATLHAEATVQDMPVAFLLPLAAHWIDIDDHDAARRWFEHAIDRAPPGEPVLARIGEVAILAGAGELAREYLQRALDSEQASGQLYLLLGMIAVMQDHDLTAARRYWRRAERLARREKDPALLERIRGVRAVFGSPAALFEMLMHGWIDMGDIDPSDLDDIDSF